MEKKEQQHSSSPTFKPASERPDGIMNTQNSQTKTKLLKTTTGSVKSNSPISYARMPPGTGENVLNTQSNREAKEVAETYYQKPVQAKSSIYLNSNDKDIIQNLKEIISNFISLESDQFNEMMEETGDGNTSVKEFLENLHMKQQ